MRRRLILAILLSLGTIGGFGWGFASMRYHRSCDSASHNVSHTVEAPK